MSRKMNDSGVDWIGQIPEHWSVQRVSQAFTFKKSKANVENPVILSLARDGIKVRDISNNEGQIAESYYNYNPVEIGDFLLNVMDLYSGANCNVSNIEGVISPAYANLRYRDNINPYFYDYYFKVQYWQMAMFAHGKGVSFDHRWTINKSDLLQYDIPKLPFAEQNEIVEVINSKIYSVNHLIKIQEKSLDKLFEYKQSVINRFVIEGIKPNQNYRENQQTWYDRIPIEWKVEKMKFNFLFGKGLSITKEDLKEEGIKTISYGEVHSKYPMRFNSSINYLKCVDVSYLSTNFKSILKNGDFIFADTSEDINGSGNYSMNEGDEVFAGYHSIIVRNNDKRVINKYLQYLFFSDSWRYQVRCGVVGIKVYSISQKLLKNCFYIIPPLEDQVLICDFLDKMTGAIDKLIKIKKQKIEKLNEYKKSIIYEYVTGKKEV